jgi:hypothetical protein
MNRIVIFLRIGAPSHAALAALADQHNGHIPDQHRGPDGWWRGTVVLSDTHAEDKRG